MIVRVRDFQKEDAPAVNRTVLAAWDQYRPVFSDWQQTTQTLELPALLTAPRSGVFHSGGCMVPPSFWGLSRKLSCRKIPGDRPCHQFFAHEWCH
jgi:hypothetical protein